MKYSREVLPANVLPHALGRIEWHKCQGDVIVVVSAALDAYLTHWCNTVGVAAICTRLEEKDGRLTGRYLEGDCCGAEKVRRIRSRYDLTNHNRVYAYGDTDDDRDMLGLADEKYFRWQRID